jgi:hypothetical protein
VRRSCVGSDGYDNEDVLFLVELSLRKKEEGAMESLLENIRKERQLFENMRKERASG